MKLKKFKERDNKKIGIIVFTIACILLVSGVILYRTFAIFEVKTNQNIINGTVQGMGDLEFVFYKDNVLTKNVPTDDGYAFDSSKSYCIERSTGNQVSNVSWNSNTKSIELNDISELGKVKCHIYFNKIYQEAELNGAIPDLGNGRLVPITLTETGQAVKANIMDTANPWYSYLNRRWANAVIIGNSYDLLGSNIYGNPSKGENYVHLDGQDDYIDLGLASYNFGNSLTAVIKSKIDNPNIFQSILGNQENAGWSIEWSTDGIHGNIHDGNYYRTIVCPVSNPEEYHTYILMYNGQQSKMYIDGAECKSMDINENILISSTSVFIGANPSPPGYLHEHFYNGDVKQAAIFNRAIDESEIQAISNENFKITNGEGLLKYVDFTNKTYEPGEVISEDNIESYFVWIPRYSYQIFNDELYESDIATQEDSHAQAIEIQFENKDTPIKNGSKNNEWLTHPAFTSFNSNGFWVGKFETSKSNDVQDDFISPTSVQIKPNVSSWKNIKVANAFYTVYDYQRELDSHMMKNTEWGAVAYLSHSEYGYVGNISPNLNTNYLTGYEGTSNPWNTVEGKKASNIQNITGVYDMAGGAWEYVVGVMRIENKEYITGESEANNSGFVGIYGSTIGQEQKSLTEEAGGLPWKDNRYYDFYEYNISDQNHSKRLLGDATGEIGPFNAHQNNWYHTHSFFIFNSYPWFIRGGSFDSNWGNYSIFSFSDAQGSAVSIASFRVVLTP